jgi:hypothetical protein
MGIIEAKAKKIAELAGDTREGLHAFAQSQPQGYPEFQELVGVHKEAEMSAKPAGQTEVMTDERDGQTCRIV